MIPPKPSGHDWLTKQKTISKLETLELHLLNLCVCPLREEVKEQLERKKKGSRALADFEDKMNEVGHLMFSVVL